MTEYKYNIIVNGEVLAKECRLPIALMIVETFVIKFYAEPNLSVTLQRIPDEKSIGDAEVPE